ncbi:MAG: hypothetical protein ACRBBN_18945 [Methyloligellaceae bacterium]
MRDEMVLIDKLEWGDYVRVRDEAPRKYSIMKFGIICGKRIVEDPETARQFGETVGTMLYLVESSDGDSIEIPERYLEQN